MRVRATQRKGRVARATHDKGRRGEGDTWQGAMRGKGDTGRGAMGRCVMKGRAGVDEREGKCEKKKKEKRKRTSLHLAFVSGRVQRARVKNGETPPLHIFQKEGAPCTCWEKRERSTGTRKKKKKTLYASLLGGRSGLV